jgi:hypothetical protein
MNLSFTSLRRVLSGIVFVGTLGFGVTQAFASPARLATYPSCERTGGVQYIPYNHCPECAPGEWGYCDGYGTSCVCVPIYDGYPGDPGSGTP